MKLKLKENGVIPTGNELLSIPAISAKDGSIESINVLSMKHKGLLESAGPKDQPLLQPFIEIDGKAVPVRDLEWELRGWWIPVAKMRGEAVDVDLTYCAPDKARGAFIRVRAKNKSGKAIKLKLGLNVAWASLNRVIYASSVLGGLRLADKAPWVDDAVVFSHRSDDTVFSWCIQCLGGAWKAEPAKDGVLKAVIAKDFDLKAGAEAEASFFLGVGLEEFSASNAAKTIRDRSDRFGTEAYIQDYEDWCLARCRKTGRPDMDELMNRNFMFNRYFAWGRALDTEELASVTSRSPRYYVCAAYWDRDAIIWSFPSLLDTDLEFAAEALDHALTTQLRNTGNHSRFIDGTLLEEGFQLDEACAPIIAFRDYIKASGDKSFLKDHARALDTLERILLDWHDPKTGLFHTHEDSQDNYVRQTFFTYANVMTWKALLALAELRALSGQKAAAGRFKKMASRLQKAVLKYCAVKGAPGAKGSILCRATDLKEPMFNDVPPGSLMKLPALGFMKESDPLFQRTYDWLHSKDYSYSNHGQPYGLPGSFRVAFTCCWAIADHLRLKRGKALAEKILAKASWDHGIVSEGLEPGNAEGVGGGGAFATAAGYVAHAIYDVYGKK